MFEIIALIALALLLVLCLVNNESLAVALAKSAEPVAEVAERRVKDAQLMVELLSAKHTAAEMTSQRLLDLILDDLDTSKSRRHELEKQQNDLRLKATELNEGILEYRKAKLELQQQAPSMSGLPAQEELDHAAHLAEQLAAKVSQGNPSSVHPSQRRPMNDDGL